MLMPAPGYPVLLLSSAFAGLLLLSIVDLTHTAWDTQCSLEEMMHCDHLMTSTKLAWTMFFHD